MTLERLTFALLVAVLVYQMFGGYQSRRQLERAALLNRTVTQNNERMLKAIVVKLGIRPLPGPESRMK